MSLNNSYKNKAALVSKINKSCRQLPPYIPSAYKTEGKAPSKLTPFVHSSAKRPPVEKLTT